eukprot:748597-Hanusia_phi.AAC.2
MNKFFALALFLLLSWDLSATWPLVESFLSLKLNAQIYSIHPVISRPSALIQIQAPRSQCRSSWRLPQRHRPSVTTLSMAKNRWGGNFDSLSSSAADLSSFRDILLQIQSANETEYPRIVGSNVEFLLRTDLEKLANMIRNEEMDETTRSRYEESFQLVLEFLEVFVSEIKQMWDNNRALLKEILQASSNGMQALDKKMEEMISGKETRYTPEFLSRNSSALLSR